MQFDRLIARKRRNAARKTSPVVEVMEDRKLLTGLVVGSSAPVVEGTGANTTMNFAVKLMVPVATTVKVSYVTANGTAKAGEDYVATSGVVTFAPGQTIQNVPVTIIGDSVPELSETLSLRLSNSSNAFIVTSAVAGTIMDDDVVAAPALAISDVTMVRGLSGSRIMSFTVKLNSAQKSAVSVSAATANATAVSGVDYLAKTELLSFAPGETSKTFNVTVFGSATTSDKIFFVKLGGTTVALTRGTAAGILKYGA